MFVNKNSGFRVVNSVFLGLSIPVLGLKNLVLGTEILILGLKNLVLRSKGEDLKAQLEAELRVELEACREPGREPSQAVHGLHRRQRAIFIDCTNVAITI